MREKKALMERLATRAILRQLTEVAHNYWEDETRKPSVISEALECLNIPEVLHQFEGLNVE